MEKEVVPHHDQWEKDGQVSREVWLRAGEQGLLCFDVDEEYGGAGVKDFRYNAIVAEEITRVGAGGLGFPVHTDVIVPYISSLATAGAEAALAAGPGLRRADLGDRDDRARRGQRPAGHPDHRGRQGRPLRAQRLQDVHQQRDHLRPGHRRGPHRPRRRTPGHQPAGGRARHGGLRAGPQPGEDRPQGAGHRRAVLRQRRGAEGEPARRGGLRLHLADAQPASGADLDRRDRGRRDRARAGPVALLRQGARGVREADRQVPAQPVRARRDGHRGPHRPGLRQRLHPQAQRRRGRRQPGLDGEVVDHRAAEEDRRPGPAAARRLRLHDRVPHRQGLRRQPDPDDLRRHHRDPEGDHRAQPSDSEALPCGRE